MTKKEASVASFFVSSLCFPELSFGATYATFDEFTINLFFITQARCC